MLTHADAGLAIAAGIDTTVAAGKHVSRMAFVHSAASVTQT